MPATQYTKRLMAQQLYHTGKHFIAAALLLRQHGRQQRSGGDEYVVLHLLCQGIEIVVKALLLYRDFDKYNRLIKRYGHNLVRITTEALTLFQLHPLRKNLADELSALNNMYMEHRLRYGLLDRFFIEPMSIPSDLVLRHAGAVVRLAEREFRRAQQ
jgi:hypothetical protein